MTNQDTPVKSSAPDSSQRHALQRPQLQLLFRHTYTALLMVDAHYRIQWANPSAEQLFFASQTKLQGLCAIDILCEIDQHNLTTKQDHQTTIDTSSKRHCNRRQKLQEQFEHAQTYQQPFLCHDQLIFGVSQSLLIDYSVMPTESVHADAPIDSRTDVDADTIAHTQKDAQKSTKKNTHSQTHDDSPASIPTAFVIEIWEKDRQSRITQEQRQQEQHDVARQMLRSVAHEVKNPLAGIRGAAQLMSKQLTQHNLSDSKITTYANIIITETDRLTDLIAQMLGSNRLPNWQLVNIHEPLEHVLTLAHSQHPDVKLIRDYDLSLPELTADKDQLIQVFLNLVNNALDAMTSWQQDSDNHSNPGTPAPDQYQPTLTLSTRVEFQYTIGNTQHKQVLKIAVNDNGSGIDQKLIGQIFFPLVTSRANGTGLGLSLVQDMVSRHQGAIDVTSSVGNTTFTVYLPFTQPQAQPKNQNQNQTQIENHPTPHTH